MYNVTESKTPDMNQPKTIEYMWIDEDCDGHAQSCHDGTVYRSRPCHC